jgi:glycosyltransferase involved in cell wall biosynthesis
MVKRILIHDYAGHPFQVQLSRELARRGYDVLHLYFGHNNTPKGDLVKRTSDPATFTVQGIYTKAPIQKYSFVKRWLQEIEYGNLITARIKTFNPHVVLSANTPLDAQKKILRACQRINCKFIFWLQDVSGLAAYRLLSKKIPVLGVLIGQYHILLERIMLRSSDQVVLIADDFKPIVEGWRVKQNSITVIPNWAPLDDVPVRGKINPWSIQHEISDKFCILYTGGLGLKHNPNLLLHLTLQFKDNEDVRIVVVAEGPGSTWLKKKKDELGLTNLLLFGYQPFKQMPDVLASGDVLVAILEPEAGLFSVPSKVLTYLCAQRPLLLAVPLDNLAAKIVTNNNAGLVVPPDDVDAFVKSAEKLVHDATMRDEYARNARAYAQKTFDIQKIGDHFEEILLRTGK